MDRLWKIIAAAWTGALVLSAVIFVQRTGLSSFPVRKPNTVALDKDQKKERKESPTLDQLVDSFKKISSPTIESFLQHLDMNDFQSPVFIYRSLSLQESSFAQPRVILSSLSGELVLAFNGDESQTGGTSIEAMQFQGKTQSFEFQELNFFDGSFRVSGKNPMVCLGCHGGTDPRPNWEPYNKWPGAYGSFAAGISKERSKQSAIELPHFESLLAKMSSISGRYRFLQSPVDEVIKDIPFYHLEALSKLTSNLANLNFARIARKMTELPFYQHYKRALLGILFCEDKLNNYVPEEVMKIHLDRRVTRQEHIGFLGTPRENFIMELNLLTEALGISTTNWSMDFGSAGKFSATHRFETPDSDTNLQMAGALILADPDFQSILEIEKRLHPQPWGGFRRIRHADQTQPPHLVCADLRRQSLEVLRKWLPTPSFQEFKNKSISIDSYRIPDVATFEQLLSHPKTPPKSYFRCLSCHSTGHSTGMEKVPALPFTSLENVKELKSELLKRLRFNRSDKRAMPPFDQSMDPAVYQKERALLIQYFESL